MAKSLLKKGKSLRNISNPNLFLFSLKYIDLRTWKIKTGDIKYVSAQKLYLDKESNRPDIVLKEVDNYFEQVLIYIFSQCAVNTYQSVRGRRYDSELRNQQGWKDSNTLENLLFW